MRSNLVPVLKIHSTEMRQMWAEKTVAVHKVVTESSEQFCVFYHCYAGNIIYKIVNWIKKYPKLK